VWGTALLMAPARMISLLGGEDEVRSRLLARVLGLRHVTQGLFEITGGNRRWSAGTKADLAHSLSALGLAAFSRRWRKAALVDALIAASFAVGSSRVAPPTHR
ncbi:MAG: hypothetical protein ACRDVW_05930, partial [Acidimicrobiales bacterium]